MGKEEAYVRAFLKKLRGYRITTAIMFGSRVRGDYLEHSDIDLLLVSPDFEGVVFPQRSADVSGYWDADISLEVVCYTPDEFEKKRRQIGMVADAVREGVRIV